MEAALKPLRQKFDRLNSMNHPLGFSLTFYSFNLPLAATFHHFGIRRAAFSQIPPLPLPPLRLCMIASSDRSSSPSLPLYLCLHTILPSTPLSISCFTVYFHHQPLLSLTGSPPLLYMSSLHLNRHSISSCTIICFLLIRSRRELQCVFVLVSRCVTD